MSNKTTLLRAFNTHFFDFIDSILKIFSDDINIMTAKNTFELTKKTNPTIIIKIWYSFVYAPYQSFIDNGDITFFFEKDYSQDLGNLSNAREILKIIDSLRQPIRNMDEENKAKSMKYIQSLSKISEMYHKV